MAINGYKFCDLSSEEIDRIKNLENELNTDENNAEDVVLLAFTEEED